MVFLFKKLKMGDNIRINSVPSGVNTAVNEDSHNLKFVAPDEINEKEKRVEEVTQELKDTAKAILSKQTDGQKMQLMMDIKIKYPTLELIDFIRDYIGSNNVEGSNYEELAYAVEDHFFKKFGSWVKKKAKGFVKTDIKNIGKTIKRGAKEVSKVVGRGGVIDKAGQKLDKLTGGAAGILYRATKNAAKTLPVVGTVINSIDDAIKVIDNTAKTGVVDLTKISPNPEVADTVSGMVAGSISLATGGKVPVKSAEDGQIKTLKQKGTTENRSWQRDLAKILNKEKKVVENVKNSNTNNANNMVLIAALGLGALVVLNK